jgi:signal transduction histidine kinase/ligand-binding sensor domain-containing protein/DNA-binding response OmpR family regulator
MIRKKCKVAILLAVNFAVFSYPDIMSQESFEHLSVNHGLSQSNVSAITQDHKGFIWFGTRGGGINRFDGYDFLVMKNDPDDSLSLSNNEVLCILEDSELRLWIGVKDGGLNRFDLTSSTFIKYYLNDSAGEGELQKSNVYDIYESRNGDLFIGHSNGIFQYSKKEDRFIKLLADIEYPIVAVTSICEDRKGRLYFASYDRLIRYNSETGYAEFLRYSPDTRWDIGNRIIPLLYDSKGRLWIGTYEGLKIVDTDSGLRFHEENSVPRFNMLAFKNVRAIHETSNENLWFCSMHGLFKYRHADGVLEEYHSDPNDISSLSSSSVNTIFEDEVGTLWIGTHGGVDILDSRRSNFGLCRHEINNDSSLSHNHVTSFQEYEGGIWIGTKEKGLNYQAGKDAPFISYQSRQDDPGTLRSNDIKSIYRDSNNDIWVGTFHGGLSLFDPVRNTFMHFMEEESVFDIQELPGRKLLLGTITGLRVMDLKDRTVSEFESGSSLSGLLNKIFIISLFAGSDGTVWIGSRYDGLFSYDPLYDEISRYRFQKSDPESLCSDYVTVICEDQEENIWIGTDNGLNLFDKQFAAIRRFTYNPDLVDKVINGLLADEAGALWIATNGGLHRFQLKTELLMHYDDWDGLQSKQFNRSACFLASNGELFFGGIGGFNRFFPDQIKDNPVVPHVVITDFKLHSRSVNPGEKDSPLDKHISETEQIILNYKQSAFSFDYVALDYLNPGNNMYSYILEGYDDTWSEKTRVRTASYMNLKPGKYRFRVRGSNNDEVWNWEGAAINIILKGPYWSTPFAFGIYVIVLSGLLLLLIQIVKYRSVKENELKQERKEKETIQEMNRMRLQYFTNISHEFRTPLSLISGPLGKLLSNKYEHQREFLLGLMNSNVNRMLRLVNQLMDFRKLENEKMQLHVKPGNLDLLVSEIVLGFEDLATRKMIELRYEANSQVFENNDQWFDCSIIDKVTFNLLSNAFKFTPKHGVIAVRLKLENQLVMLSVEDTGKGISPEKVTSIFERYYSEPHGDQIGTGIGLSLSKKLIDLHKGEITVESDIGKGATFIVTLPVGKDAYEPEEIVTNQEQLPYNRPQFDTDHVVYNSNCMDQHRDKSGQNILIVEDDPELAEFLKGSFDGYNTFVAENGMTGYLKAREIMPDIIISDIMMDEMNGLELCRKIKQDFVTSHIPVILLTAKTDLAQRIEGIETGADAYLEKPFDLEYLSVLVKNLLVQRQLLREKYSEFTEIDIKPESDSMSGPDQNFLEKIDNKIYELLSNPELSVEHLMEAVAMSRTQLYRKFRQLINKSPNEYIRIIRLKHARSLLAKGEFNVNEVATMSGFGNVPYFITSFKNHFGMSPGNCWHWE